MAVVLLAGPGPGCGLGHSCAISHRLSSSAWKASQPGSSQALEGSYRAGLKHRSAGQAGYLQLDGGSSSSPPHMWSYPHSGALL